MYVAGGEEVGGGGVEHRGELQHGRLHLRHPGHAGDSRAESLTICCVAGLFQIQHIPNGGHLAVLDAHDVVEQRVEGGGEVVEAAGEVEEDLVDGSEHLEMFEVDVAEPLDVEGGPGHEEEDNNGNCRIVT